MEDGGENSLSEMTSDRIVCFVFKKKKKNPMEKNVLFGTNMMYFL